MLLINTIAVIISLDEKNGLLYYTNDISLCITVISFYIAVISLISWEMYKFMKKEYLKIEQIPSILWGDTSQKLYLFIHGKDGSKEDAKTFANIATQYGWQVLSVDLPEHGERNLETNSFDPWHVVPELLTIMNYAKSNWKRFGLRANSIGAWFSLLCFTDESFETCQFVSPILDMHQLICNMMQWASVTESQLQTEKTIETSFGQTLSLDYLTYAKEHHITKWPLLTYILYAEHDNLTEYNVVDQFTKNFGCKLTIMEHGEHWFHTPEQIKFMEQWTIATFEDQINSFQ